MLTKVSARHVFPTLCLVCVLSACWSGVLAYTHDSGEFDPSINGAWYSCGNDKATSAGTNDGRGPTWDPGWDFRGIFRFDERCANCADTNHGKNVVHHLYRRDGSQWGTRTWSQCGCSGNSWYTVANDAWWGDSDRVWRVKFDAYNDTAYPNCYSGYNAVSMGKGHC